MSVTEKDQHCKLQERLSDLLYPSTLANKKLAHRSTVFFKGQIQLQFQALSSSLSKIPALFIP